YRLPFFSTMRIPMKFLHPFHISLIILFAHGLEGMRRVYLSNSAAPSASWLDQIKRWWKNRKQFERSAVILLASVALISVFGVMIFSASRGAVEGYLQTAPTMVGTPPEVFGFSIREAWLYLVLLLAIATLLVTIASGWFSGSRARVAYFLLGIL